MIERPPQFHPPGYDKKPKLPFLPGENLADWNRERVITAVVKLNTETPLTTLKSMRVNREPIPDPTLSKFSGRATSRKFLHFAGCHFFGSWNSVLRACEIEPIIPAYNKFWTKTVIIGAIKQLKSDGHPLTVFGIWRDRSRKTSISLKRVTGKLTTGAGLHDAARRYFGSWDKALERSGINPETIKERPFWTRKKVVRSIKKLHVKGVALNTSKIGTDSSHVTAWMIEQELGKGRLGRSLYGASCRIFGSWDRALYEAGINPLVHRRRPFSWNVKQLARVLNVLHQMQIPVNSGSLAHDTSDQTASLIFDLTGRRTTGTCVHRILNQRLGNWDSVLKFSGFWLSEIRRSGSPCERNPDKVVDMIRLFHRHEIALNRSAMIANSHKSKFLVEQHFGAAVSGKSLMDTAHGLFGSWDKALWEAGLDPNAIRLRSRPHTTSLPVISYQVEDVKRANGEFGLSKFMGNLAKSPEDAISELEQASALQEAVDQLSDDDKCLSDRIFDAILQIHHYRDQDQLVKFVAENLNHEVTEEQVRGTLARLKKNLCPSLHC